MKKLLYTLFVLGSLGVTAQAQTTAPAASSDLMITEYQFRAISGNNDSLEFIEIMNTTDQPLDVSGVKVLVATSQKHTFPANTVLNPYEIVVLAFHANVLQRYYNMPTAPVQMNATSVGNMPNSANTIFLRTSNNTLLDSVRYSTSLGNLTGKTVEFCDLTQDNKATASGWAESTTPVLKADGSQNSAGGYLMFGTPGYLAAGCEWPRPVANPCATVTITAEVDGCGADAEVLNAAGGVAPYTYEWSNAATAATVNNLVVGETYTVTITDDNGCTGVATYTPIACPDPCATVTITAAVEGCGVDAEVLNAAGGVAPYTYEWSNGETTATVNNLVAGETYTVTITDDNGCTGVATYEAEACPVVDPCLTTTITAAVEGCGADAEVLNAAGGVAPYTYEWSNAETTATVNNLVAGETYTVTITDDNGCTSVATYEAVACPVVDPCLTTTITVEVEGCDESASVLNAAGGVAPYTYAWSNGETTETVNNLVAGETYTVTITDDNGCEVIETFEQTICNSIDKVAAGFNMSVYPNPAKDAAILSLETANATDLQVELVNVMGQVISSQALVLEGTMTYNLAIENLTAGVYFVKVSSKAGVATQRLVIAK